MCGIFCLIKIGHCNKLNSALEKCESVLKRRGPNVSGNIQKFNCEFWAYVLWQQGHEPCSQPTIDESENHILIFNGDAFTARENLNLSDTWWLFERLVKCETDADFRDLFKIVKGPWSFVYFDVEKCNLWFGRDSLGRNSLLLGHGAMSGDIILSSVMSKNAFNQGEVVELPPLGLYCFNINVESFTINKFSLLPWTNSIKESAMHLEQLKIIESLLHINCEIKNGILPNWLELNEQTEVNYNFQTLAEQNTTNDLFSYLLNCPEILSVCNKIIQLLSCSIKERVVNTPELCKTCISANSCSHPRLGILFSGGIDCTIIALLANNFVDPSISIDLLNVAFEKPKANTSDINWDVPDRISAKSSLKELQTLCPTRQWKLVEVNVTRQKLEFQLTNHMSNLIYPLTTILDESLGAALWFASSGSGLINNEPYLSPCRVLLLGSGADELFGGYTRHRNAFLREGNDNTTATLKSELELDWQRLPSRNLARDDRVICDHGVTPRTPFLQEDLVQYIRNLAPLQKCYHKLEQGVGDKLLLRLCAYKLGLRESAVLKKRALQFGSRIAIPKQNANEVSKYLQ